MQLIGFVVVVASTMRSFNCCVLTGLLVAVAWSRPAMACDSMAFWSRLPDTASEFASPLPLVLFSGALVPPLAMIPTGADYQLRLFAMRDLHGKPNAEPVSVWTPYVMPVVVLGVNVVALSAKQCDVARPSSAMLQAMGLSLAVVTSLKFVTGRSWPSGGMDPHAVDYYDHPESAHRLHWFSWNHGTAWPSGHTAIMVSAATALSTVEYGRSWLGVFAYGAAAAVATGMWLGDHHWMSDILSGALMGVSIGRSVGLAFRRDAPMNSAAGFVIVPYSGRDSYGLQALARW